MHFEKGQLSYNMQDMFAALIIILGTIQHSAAQEAWEWSAAAGCCKNASDCYCYTNNCWQEGIGYCGDDGVGYCGSPVGNPQPCMGNFEIFHDNYEDHCCCCDEDTAYPPAQECSSGNECRCLEDWSVECCEEAGLQYCDPIMCYEQYDMSINEGRWDVSYCTGRKCCCQAPLPEPCPSYASCHCMERQCWEQTGLEQCADGACGDACPAENCCCCPEDWAGLKCEAPDTASCGCQPADCRSIGMGYCDATEPNCADCAKINEYCCCQQSAAENP